jgi:3-methyladenine DNA glycosylase AlkD
MSSAQEVLRELEALGTEQTRKTWRRHGVGDNVYGVRYAELGALKKRIKQDHALAQQLWASGNHDARTLATMIADPAQMDEQQSEAWADDLHNYVTTGALADLVGAGPAARACMERWTASDEEWRGSAGWQILGQMAMNDATLPDAYFMPYLATIERDIHTRKNRVRYAMNNALIAIGGRNPALEQAALAVAAAIGKVQVDHGQTNCKTPDAIASIHKTRAHQDARQASASRR